MDIYQIWTTYNKQWSRYEILAFVGILILVCIAMTVYVYRKKLSVIQAAAVLVLVVFLGIVFGSKVSFGKQLEKMPSIRENHRSRMSILRNIWRRRI